MKNKRFINYIIVVTALLLAACNKQLDLYPKDALSEPTFFKNANDLKLYCNQFYQNLPVQNSCWSEKNSDNQVPLDADDFLYGSYVVPVSGGGWDWWQIRACNYFLQRYQRANADDATKNKYVAEIRFFRALFYWQKVKTFGDVPWLNTDLTDTSTALLYGSRMPRKQVMDSVLADLNFAVANLPDLNTADAGRLHKYAAYSLMSRICLWEGTFRKYHGTGDETVYLNAAVTASEAVMNSGNYDIYSTGNPTKDYYNLFIQEDLSNNKEAILPAIYIQNVLTQNLTRELGESSTGFSKNFVRSFLCKDGLPTALSPLYKGDDSLEAEATNRDPRFRQLIATRGFVLLNNADGTKNIFTLPQIGTATAPTGYMIIKALSPDPAQWNAGQSTLDLFIFRYAEILLNEAEAKAELGQCTQTVLDNTVNKIRDRVGMAHMDIATLVKDPESDFPALPVLIDEIRRERRIELAADGFRFDDIMRWKAGELIQNPETILGMKLTPAVRAQYPASQVSGVQVDANNYIRLYTSITSRVWKDKMYLYPIPTQELTLNQKLLPQNPGW
ncbi:RagB/SusD family nutrient uptake outer membrane protein [Chitinophaga filiformis]|uniref:Starch-binding associating with outer membrane n=1 Tax=Chitinophaga filiformis TaxID=104663 RepID=A0A1G7M496_CHIFI|nr:RagB/SusD family nutrient uptake outer membrane protein [Chitinophaga filiformis]SDF56612.1 Starch-binding associating with outer membrane [Chitinophaga filiformis]